MALSSNSNNNNSDTNSDNNILKTYYINKDGPIPAINCQADDINNKIIVIESKYCGACKIFMDTLDELKDTNYIFHIYDVSETDQRKYIQDILMLDFKYTPTTIIGCDAYLGAIDKNELVGILSKYNLEQK